MALTLVGWRRCGHGCSMLERTSRRGSCSNARPQEVRRRVAAPTASFSSSSTSRLTFKDPSHPTGLYYHLLPSPPAFESTKAASDDEATQQWALTLLEKEPSSPTAHSILAYLRAPPDAPDAATLAAYARAYPDNIEAHADGMRTLHDTLRRRVVALDPHLAAEAAMRGSGWAHLSDARHALMPGRIPTPDNILASVAFVDGEFLSNPERDAAADAGAYQVNDTYRLMNREEGFLQVQDAWLELVRQRFEEVN